MVSCEIGGGALLRSAGRATERDHRRDTDAVGEPDDLAQLRFRQHVPHGHHAAVATVARREQQVLTRGVDRGALGEVGVVPVSDAGEHDDRCLLEVVDEVLHGGGHARLG